MTFSEQTLAEAAIKGGNMELYQPRNDVALRMPGQPPPTDEEHEWREVMLPKALWPFRNQELEIEGVILVWRYGKPDELRMRAGVQAICYWPEGRKLTLTFWHVALPTERWEPIRRGVNVRNLSHEWESRLAQIHAEQEQMMKARFPDAYETNDLQ